MNKEMLKNELAVFFQTLPVENIDLDENFVNNFSNLFFRYLAEMPGEGILYPEINRVAISALSDPIKDIFKENLSGIATQILTSQEYSSKVGSALDSIIELLPQVFVLTPSDQVIIAQFKLTTDIVQLLDPIFKNPLSTSFDLANAIVEGFTIKLNASSVFNANSGITINWITN